MGEGKQVAGFWGKLEVRKKGGGGEGREIGKSGEGKDQWEMLFDLI